MKRFVGTLRTTKKLYSHLLWLRLRLWVALAAGFAMPSATNAYKGPNQTTVAYDSSYAASVLAADVRQNGSIGSPVIFAKFAGFLATEGAGVSLALPGVRQVDCSWGALNTYGKGGQMTAIEHVNYRHARPELDLAAIYLASLSLVPERYRKDLDSCEEWVIETKSQWRESPATQKGLGLTSGLDTGLTKVLSEL